MIRSKLLENLAASDVTTPLEKSRIVEMLDSYVPTVDGVKDYRALGAKMAEAVLSNISDGASNGVSSHGLVATIIDQVVDKLHKTTHPLGAFVGGALDNLLASPVVNQILQGALNGGV